MNRTVVILSQSLDQDLDVDTEPCLLALAGLGALVPVAFFHSLLHPRLFGNFLFDVRVKVVDHRVVHQTHGCELVDPRKRGRFGEGRVDVREGMLLYKSHGTNLFFHFLYKHINRSFLGSLKLTRSELRSRTCGCRGNFRFNSELSLVTKVYYHGN